MKGVQTTLSIFVRVQILTLRDEFKKKNGKISDIEQKGGRGVESISLFLTD